MMRLHFDLTGISGSLPKRWRARLDTWLAASPPGLVSETSAEEADIVLALGSTLPLKPRPDPRAKFPWPKKTFTWDSGDFPSGHFPGLYAGLPVELHEPSRHDTFCYPFRWNPFISLAAPEEARHLAGFLGGLTSPLRSHIVSTLSGRPGFEIAVAESLWHRMDDPTASEPKLAFAAHTRSCRFILCPRGNGVSSVRLFEAMEAGRVPVVISDRFVPPADPAWKGCVLRVREQDVARLPDILREADADWPALAARARAYWENNYSDSRLFPALVDRLERLRALGAGRPGLGHRVRLLRFAGRQLPRDAYRRLRGVLP